MSQTTSLFDALNNVNKNNAPTSPARKVYIIGAKGMNPVNLTPTFKIGDVVRKGGGDFYVVVSDEIKDYEYGQRAISTDGFRETEASPDMDYELTDQEPYSAGRIAALLEAYNAHRNSIQEKQAAKKQAENELLARGKEIFEAAKPSWAKAVIVAELKEDKSDPMSDYFHASTSRTVVLAFSATERNDFGEMRNAAALFADTKELAAVNKALEHRENYSGGSGYYLGKSHYHGWNIRKTSMCSYNMTKFYRAAATEGDFIPAARPGSSDPEAPAQAAGSGNVSVTFNEAKGGIEIRFPSKPDEATLSLIKSAGGWRWSRFAKCWYAKRNSRTEAFANSL